MSEDPKDRPFRYVTTASNKLAAEEDVVYTRPSLAPEAYAKLQEAHAKWMDGIAREAQVRKRIRESLGQYGVKVASFEVRGDEIIAQLIFPPMPKMITLDFTIEKGPIGYEINRVVGDTLTKTKVVEGEKVSERHFVMAEPKLYYSHDRRVNFGPQHVVNEYKTVGEIKDAFKIGCIEGPIGQEQITADQLDQMYGPMTTNASIPAPDIEPEHADSCICETCMDNFFGPPDVEETPKMGSGSIQHVPVSVPKPVYESVPAKEESAVDANVNLPADAVCYFCGHTWKTRGMVGRMRSTGAPICIDCAVSMGIK